MSLFVDLADFIVKRPVLAWLGVHGSPFIERLLRGVDYDGEQAARLPLRSRDDRSQEKIMYG